MLSLNNVAKIFGVPAVTVLQWCKQGKIKAYPTGTSADPGFSHEDVAIAYLVRSIQKCLGH